MARVQGLESFKRKVTRLRTGVQAEVQVGLLKAGDVIVAEQKRLAPVDPVDGGTLRDSITRKLSRGEKSGNQAVRISTSVFYAPFVEFGTAKHEGSKHPGTTAQPFFFPGFRATRKKARAIINKAVRDSVKKAVT